MKKIKIYIAGKVSPNSVFGRHDWRDEFCLKLEKITGFKIINIDPTGEEKGQKIDQNNTPLIVGRCSFMIKNTDIVVVNLTDDISVGGSQEMVIAKYFKKPLVGLAPRGGKFNKLEKEMLGKLYKNYLDPFVDAMCDKVVIDINGVAEYLKEYFSNIKEIKDISVLDKLLKYYEENYYDKDDFLKKIIP